MPRPSSNHRVQDMYWFAHGGIEPSTNERNHTRENTPCPGDTEDESSEGSSLSCKVNQDRLISEESASSFTVKQGNIDRQEAGGRTNSSSKRLAVEERKRQILEAEQEKNEAILKKHAEREAALEARRNAQRSNISFAFGTSHLPMNAEFDIAPVQLQPSVPSLHSKTSTTMMSQSMVGSVTATRGRRKNDLTPTVPYDRTGAALRSATAPGRKRSVSMSRLDALAQPRKHYVEAQKAGSTMSNSSSTRKDGCQSPKRPLSSASEKSNKSNRNASTPTAAVNRRPQAATRKPRPISIAGSVPDDKFYAKTSAPLRKPLTPSKQDGTNAADGTNIKSSTGKRQNTGGLHKSVVEKQKNSSPTAKSPAAKSVIKNLPSKQSSPKISPSRKLLTNKKQAAMLVPATAERSNETVTEVPKQSDIPTNSTCDEDTLPADEKTPTKQHIISEEEAKATLAEKRRLAREQAEKEALIQKLHKEELERERERQLRQEEERQRLLEEEQLRLLEEHRKFEEEKLQKAIEEQERKDEEEKIKREEEARLKAEQERKAKEEAEKQRIELEEKLRKEEEERAERKKRLEKIMSRTRGKSGTASPSGSLNGSEPLDSMENQPLSSEPSSLESNEQFRPTEHSSPNESLDANQNLYLASQSLSSNDLMLPSSEHTSLDGSLPALLSEPTSLDSHKDAFVAGEDHQPRGTDSVESDVKSDCTEVVQDELLSQKTPPATVSEEPVVPVDKETESSHCFDNQNMKSNEDSLRPSNENNTSSEILKNDTSLPIYNTEVAENPIAQSKEAVIDSVGNDSKGINVEMCAAEILSSNNVSSEFSDTLLSEGSLQEVEPNSNKCPADSLDNSKEILNLQIPEQLISSVSNEIADVESMLKTSESDGAEAAFKKSSLNSELENEVTVSEFSSPSGNLPSSNENLSVDVNQSEMINQCLNEESLRIDESFTAVEKDADMHNIGSLENVNSDEMRGKLLIDNSFTDSDIICQTSQVPVSASVDIDTLQISSNESGGFLENTKELNMLLEENKSGIPLEVSGSISTEDKDYSLPKNEVSTPLLQLDKDSNEGLFPLAPNGFGSTEVPDSTHTQLDVFPAAADENKKGSDKGYDFSTESNPFLNQAVDAFDSCLVKTDSTSEMSDGLTTSNVDVAYDILAPANITIPQINPDFGSSGTCLVPVSLSSENNGCEQPGSRTQNPFGDVDSESFSNPLLPTNNGLLNSAVDFIIEESEDSSLDSNLSQVLNVHTNDKICEETNVSAECLHNGQAHFTSTECEQSSPCDMEDVSKPNHCNGSTYDGRPRSADVKADQLSSSSEKLQHLTDNGNFESRDIFCFDRDTINSNKVASNPFLGVNEANPFSSNPF